MRAFGIADQFSIHLENPGHVVLTLSPGMTSHIRDATYHLAEDPAADASWNEPDLELLTELGHALSDALDLMRAREG